LKNIIEIYSLCDFISIWEIIGTGLGFIPRLDYGWKRTLLCVKGKTYNPTENGRKKHSRCSH